MDCVTVEIPAGLHPGDPMSITVGDDEFTITVPDGLTAGALLCVDLPSKAPPPLTVLVAVPHGCYEGDEFTIEADGGLVFSVCVPTGSPTSPT